MTSPSPMTREELLELAYLDAYGLLDEYESALFTRSFHHAHASVQDEVRDLQAGCAGDPTLLPDVEPPAELKASVVSLVRKTIEAETPELSPIATIGGYRSSAAASSARSNGWGAGFWRAAAFVLLATSIALGYTLSEVAHNGSQIAEMALRHATGGELEQRIGPFLNTYWRDPQTEFVVLASMDGETRVYANIFVRPHEKDACLLVHELPIGENTTYELTYSDSKGMTHYVGGRLESGGERTGRHVALDLASLALEGGTWALTVTLGDGQIIQLS